MQRKQQAEHERKVPWAMIPLLQTAADKPRWRRPRPATAPVYTPSGSSGADQAKQQLPGQAIEQQGRAAADAQKADTKRKHSEIS